MIFFHTRWSMKLEVWSVNLLEMGWSYCQENVVSDLFKVSPWHISV